MSLLCIRVTKFSQDLNGDSEDRRRDIIHNALSSMWLTFRHFMTPLPVGSWVLHTSDTKQLVAAQPEGCGKTQHWMSGPVSHPQLLCGHTNIKVFKRLVFICPFKRWINLTNCNSRKVTIGHISCSIRSAGSVSRVPSGPMSQCVTTITTQFSRDEPRMWRTGEEEWNI